MENIAIIITKLKGGGAERCASNLSIELSKLYNVFLITFDGTDIKYPYGGQLIDLNIGVSGNSISRAINNIRRIAKVREIKKKYNISATISLLDTPNMVNVLSRVNDKVYVSIRNCLSKEGVGKLRYKLIRMCSNKANKTVALSKFVREDLIKNFDIAPDKVITIYNHCDKALLMDLANKTDIDYTFDDNSFYFVTMGRLNRQKGQWHLLRAFQRVAKLIPEARLIVLGKGELEESLKKLADDLKISERVDFLGFIENPHAIIARSDAFVFPSLFEGLGNVLLEALAIGIPIISSDCFAGPREILAPNTSFNTQCADVEVAEYGILTPVCDEGHFEADSEITYAERCLSDAMIRIYEDKQLKENYIKKSCIRISDFNKEKIIDEWVRLINET